MDRIELTDTEWMSLIDGERGQGTLQKCCGNISDLRDQVIQIARDGGEYRMYAVFLLRAYRAAADGHQGLETIPALVKIRDACLAYTNTTLDQLLDTPHADRDYIEG